MLITVTVRDKRMGRGIRTEFFHETDITPEIYKFVKRHKTKVDYIWSVQFVYYHSTNPSIDDFLNDYKHLN